MIILIVLPALCISRWLAIKCTYMLYERVAYLERHIFTLLQLSKEVLAVELVDLFQVAKDDIHLASEYLRYIISHQLRDVVVNDKL